MATPTPFSESRTYFTEADRALATFLDESTPELAIAVAPNSIGGGVGSRLMEELTKEADAREIPQIVLSVRDNVTKDP